MRRPMVAGNWKMHGSRSANQALLTELELRHQREWAVDIAVFPPFVYLSDAHVLVGHSERRRLYHEDDVLVCRKFAAAQSAGLVPVLCVGETLDEREAGGTHSVIARQLDAVLTMHGVSSLTRAIIAYEPVWAIGTGKNAEAICEAAAEVG